MFSVPHRRVQMNVLNDVLRALATPGVPRIMVEFPFGEPAPSSDIEISHALEMTHKSAPEWLTLLAVRFHETEEQPELHNHQENGNTRFPSE